jgi:ATP-binding cassette subfamily A (ABC1) protein 3
MLSFFVASFFSSSFRATIAAVLLCLVGYFLTLVSDYSTGNASTILAVSIHPVTAMCYGLQVLGSLEEKQVGLVTELLNFSDSASNYTFSKSLGMLFIDIFIWAGFSFYFIRVIQGNYGRRYPWYFLFTRSYWCPVRQKSQIIPIDSNSLPIPKEEVPLALKEQEKDGKALIIRGLTKRFGDKTAVDGLDLEMYTGQIFALLGDNGAGTLTGILLYDIWSHSFTLLRFVQVKQRL